MHEHVIEIRVTALTLIEIRCCLCDAVENLNLFNLFNQVLDVNPKTILELSIQLIRLRLELCSGILGTRNMPVKGISPLGQ